jgi:formamidopyrimidine-DNA glycosylase
MPELPEVETTRRAIEPLIVGRKVTQVVFRVAKLRRPVPTDSSATLIGQPVLAVQRRAKYLLIRFPTGTLLLHLGMTGHLHVVPVDTPPQRHDHVALEFSDGTCLRFNDSRRFGLFLWTAADPLRHPLLAHLGPEPLGSEMSGAFLHARAGGRRAAVKSFIMDQRTVVGVGNIYASEALFRAGIHPAREAGRVGLQGYERLVGAIREVLSEAIAEGGTTMGDFLEGGGRPGYFRLRLQVYGREGKPCPRCGRPIERIRLGQRSTYFCRTCQT